MSDEHEELIEDWRRNAVNEAVRNSRFLRSLRLVDDPEEVDALAAGLHEDAFGRIDCTRCANCCKTMQPGFTREDIARIAGHLGMAEEAFVVAYLEAGEWGDLQTRTVPCPFLGGDDRCMIYEVRPQACRDFPHTDKEGFATRTHLHASNTLTCPAAYHVVKALRRVRRGG